MFSKLYDKCLKLASHKSANLYLSIVSFIESSFFPIPPDVMIIPMAIAKNKNYLKIFLNATIFSVLGGLLGYFIGFAFFFHYFSNILNFINIRYRSSTKFHYYYVH